MYDKDTITAISTPLGTGGIGIIRISGPEAESIIKRIFRLKTGALPAEFRDRQLYFGNILDVQGNVIDQVMAVLMRAPKSYTCEDVAEIHCHGGIIPLKCILKLAIQNGARPAQPGEFTKRAFLNGRIDLTQAEAVMDIISADSEEAARISAQQMNGMLGMRIRSMQEQLLDILAGIEADIDYPEDDVEQFICSVLLNRVTTVLGEIQRLLATSEYGRIIRLGLKVAIVGKPNVGKSSLLNALLKDNRAIVTHIPGTTRDVIEESLNIKGISVRILDTAGIRNTADVVEMMGIARSKTSIEQADLVLLMLDASSAIDDEDINVIKMAAGKKSIIVLNKTDLPVRAEAEEISKLSPHTKLICTSIVRDKGIEDIEECIYNMFCSAEVKNTDDLIITNARHSQALDSAAHSLSEAVAAIKTKIPVDIVSIDIRDAWQTLGSITGEWLAEDLIDKIFSKFCLGK